MVVAQTIEAYPPEHDLPDWDDLRGRARPLGSAHDIGAYEFTPAGAGDLPPFLQAQVLFADPPRRGVCDGR